MADLAAIRTGLATNLAAIQTAQPDVQVYAYVPENPVTPCLQVLGPDAGTPLTFGDDEQIDIVVAGYVSAVVDIASQERLDAWWNTEGAASVEVAIESDVTLGGACDSLAVVSKGGYRIYTPPNLTRVLGMEWTVRILA